MKIDLIGCGKESNILVDSFENGGLSGLSILYNPEDGVSYRDVEQNFDENRFIRCLDESDFANSSRANPAFLVLCGNSLTAGAALRMLQCLRSLRSASVPPSIIYVRRENQAFLSADERQSEAQIGSALQEHARYGLLSRAILIDRDCVELATPNLNFRDYDKQINEFIAGVISNIEFLRNEKPIYGGFDNSPGPACIETIGLMETNLGVEQGFYDLKYVREKNYLFCINEEELNGKNGNKLIKNFKDLIIKKKEKDEEKVNFAVYSSPHPGKTCYTIYKSSINQNYIG